MALYTAGAGPILSPAEVESLVVRPVLDQAVSALVSHVIQVGSHDLRVPVVLTDPQASFVPEGGEIPATDGTLTEIVVTPKKLAALSVISSELANDSSPAALQVVGDGMVRDVKRALDASFFKAAPGTTPDGPSGLGSLTTAVASNAGSWANLDSFEAAKANAETLHTEVTAFVAAPATILALSTLKEYGTAGSNKPLLSTDVTQPVSRTISGVPLYSSPAVSADVVWALPAQHVLFVIRQGADLVSDSSVMFTSDRVAIRITMRVSYAFTLPLAVTKITKA
jgi:HK97 family phage major capsid protein